MAPNGLYLNSTTSGTNSNAVLMKGFQEGTANEIYAYYYCDRVRYSPNPWSGETVYSHSELSFLIALKLVIQRLIYLDYNVQIQITRHSFNHPIMELIRQ